MRQPDPPAAALPPRLRRHVFGWCGLGAGTICSQYLLTALLILAFAVLVGVVLARQG